MSDEETKNALGRPERLFENLISVKFSIFFKCSLKLHKPCYITFRVFRCVRKHFLMLEKSISRYWKQIEHVHFWWFPVFIQSIRAKYMCVLFSDWKFFESLYEPFCQWLGWQFTGGSKCRLPGDEKLEVWEFFFNSFWFKLSRGRLIHY